MESIFSEILQEGPWVWIFFVFGVVVSFFIFAQRSAAPLGGEIFRAIGSIFASPFVYLRKTVLELSLGDENPRLVAVDHYLLRRVLVLAQVIVLVSVFIGSGVGLATAVLRFLPPSWMRHQEDQYITQISKTEKALESESRELAKEDSDWTARRDQLVQQARQQEKQKKSDAEAALSTDEAAIKSSEGIQVLNTVRNFLTERGGFYGAVDQAKSFISRMPLSDIESHALAAYCDHWQALQSVSNGGPKTLDQIRAEVQPDHDQLVSSVASDKEQLASLRSSLSELGTNMSKSYSPGQFVLTLASFFMFFLVFIWLGGTGIEIFSMSLYLTSDVKQIRAQTEKSAIYQ